MPGVAIGAIVGAALVLLESHSPAALRMLAIAASAVFALFSTTYFYWSFGPATPGTFRWSKWERLGLASSGLGALLMSGKLGFPNQIPGSTFAYFIAALLLAFVIRPMLESAGFRKTNSKSVP